MFNRTHLASAVFVAMSSHIVMAQENQVEETQNQDVEVIEVSGIRASLNKSLNIKRQEKQVVDAIVAQDIGKFPDNNVAEALQRVTGVQVTDRGAGEVNTVSIRGLTDVTTTLNGRNIFTTSGRSLALADVPAALLESVNVYKTRSASQIGSGIAGQIDISTQRPFNFEGSKVVVAGRAINQEQADTTDPQFSLLASNRWDVGGGEFGALLNLSFARTTYRDQSITAGAVLPFADGDPALGFLNSDGGVTNYSPYQRIFGTDCATSCWQAGLEQGLPNAEGSTLSFNGATDNYLLSRDAVFGSDLNGKRERPAVNLSLQWAPNDSSIYTFEAFYNGYRDERFNSLFFTFVDSWSRSDELEAPVLFEGTNVIKERQVYDPYQFISGDFTKSETDTYMFALNGQWFINDSLSLESEVYYQKSEYETNFLAMRTERIAPGLDVDFNSGDGIPALELWDNADTAVDESDMSNAALWNTNQMYDNGGGSEGDAITWTLDGEYSLFDGVFERIGFGVFVDKRSASESTRATDGSVIVPLSSYDEEMTYTTSGFFDGQANFPSTWAVANGYYLYANRDEFRNIYGLNPDNLVLEKTFDIDETTLAAYIEGDFLTELWGKELDGQIGLRYEHAKADMTFYDIASVDYASSTADSSSSTFLPSIVLRYHLTDDVLARFAYTETIRRPGFTDLNSFITWQEDVTGNEYGQANGGNPQLEPVESQNFDLTLEYYFGEGSSVYATWFKRDIEGLVYSSLTRVEYEGDEENEAGQYILSQPGNTSNGTLDGWEFGAIYFPEELPDYLDGIGLQASATLLNSEQDIPQFDSETGELTGYIQQGIFGVSDLSYSTVLIYEKEDFSARLSYVWRDDFLASYEAAVFANPRGIYRQPEKSLDFQLSYDATENLTVTLDATNLTEEIYQSYYEDPEVYNFGSALYSRTFALGFRYSM